MVLPENLKRPVINELQREGWKEIDAKVASFLDNALSKDLNVDKIMIYIPETKKEITYKELLQKVSSSITYPMYELALSRFLQRLPDNFDFIRKNIRVEFKRLVEKQEEIITYLDRLEGFIDELEVSLNARELENQQLRQQLVRKELDSEKKIVELQDKLLSSLENDKVVSPKKDIIPEKVEKKLFQEKTDEEDELLE